LHRVVVGGNIQMRRFRYDHLVAKMKKVPSAFSPVIAVDRKIAKPLHRQLYDSYRAMIVGRGLRAGQQIPSTRALAIELGISRIPVLTAYAQLLAEGYFEARAGSGTFVCSTLPEQLAPTERRDSPSGEGRRDLRPVARRTAHLPTGEDSPWVRGFGAFNISHPAYEYFPFQVWSNLVMRHCRNPSASALHYGDPLGSEELRDAICTYLRTARGVRCDPQHVMIVAGSQQALEISARVLLDPGTPVWVEEPGYWLTRRVLALAGCRMIPVPVDADGLNVTAGIKRCHKARAAYVAPSHQYPLGATMSASRRLQLLNWAQSSGSWIVEDDYDSEYRYGSMPIASLQGLDSNSRVIYIGTFSKVLFPSMRTGYMVIPPDLVDRFVAVRQALDLTHPNLYQAVLADFLREGHFARHLRRLRLVYSERRTALVDSLHQQFGSRLQVHGAQAGMHLVVSLPRGFHDQEIAERAALKKLWLWPLSPAYLGRALRQGFILGFGSTRVAEIPDDVQRLKSVLIAEGVLTEQN
jgi:GntR family transcriptional regulator / MocR family aminotransferase